MAESSIASLEFPESTGKDEMTDILRQGAQRMLAQAIREEIDDYDFPAEHWIHVRTTNPIESTFATVRLRAKRTKGSGARTACQTMVFKLMQSAQKRWRALNGSERLPDVIQGIRFQDGIRQPKAAA